MAFSRTKKLLAAAAMICGLAGCAAQDTTPAKVLAPTGAPALSTIGIEQETATVDYVEGQDVLISELNKSDGDYDVIIAPINLGIKSWNEAETYMLNGVVTWGNLYMVGTEQDWNVAGNTVAAFGEGAVPGLVFNQIYDELNCDVTFYPSVAEASQALISGAVNTALLAQPAATAAMSKTEGTSVQADLQELWQQKENTQMKGYPQAAVFVKKGSEEKAADVVKEMTTFLDGATPESITTRVEEIGADALGMPSAEIAGKTFEAQNIHYEKASDVKDDIKSFLDVFGMELPDSIFE